MIGPKVQDLPLDDLTTADDRSNLPGGHGSRNSRVAARRRPVSGERNDLRPASLLLALLIILFFNESTSLAQGFRSPRANDFSSLRSLPPMRAIPINSQGTSAGLVNDALSPPAYCDSDALRPSGTIRAIRFWDKSLGIAVGDHGSILTTRNGGQSWTQSTSNVQCQLNDATWIDANRVVAVGGGLDFVTRLSRGVVLVSKDAGQSWQRSNDSDLPRLRSVRQSASETRVSGDRKRLLTAHGDSDPISGASAFESRDAGRSWQSLIKDDPNWLKDTHQSVTSGNLITAEHSSRWAALAKIQSVIRTSCRVDDQTLVCAGDHGSILRSTDGGQTWQSVHGENACCAVLVIAARQDQIPWSLIGRESLEKRLRTNLVVGVSDRQTADTLFTDGLTQAAMQVGAAAADTYPAANSAETIESLKRWIEVHHPPIVALDASLTPEIKSALLQHAVASGTNKVVEYSSVDRGETLLHHSAMLPDCGVLAGDFEGDCRILISDFDIPSSFAPSNPWVSIKTRYSGGSQLTRGDSLGIGVRLTSRHRLPPRVSKASHRRLQVIQGRLKQQAAIDDLFRSRKDTNTPHQGKRFSDAMKRLLDQTSRADQFRSAWSIAHESIGKPTQTLVWDEIADRFADSSAGRLAGLHAQTRRASIEWQRHRIHLHGPDVPYALITNGNPIAAQVGTAAPMTDPSTELLPSHGGHASIVSPFQTPPFQEPQSRFGVVQASASLPLDNQPSNDYQSHTRKAPPGEIDLAWQMHPVRLIVAAAIARNQHRETPDPAIAVASQPTDETPAEIALAEIALAEIALAEIALADETPAEKAPAENAPAENAPAEKALSADVRRVAERHTQWSNLLKRLSPQTAIAARADARPRLDGQLDEPFWNTTHAKPATTRDMSGLKLQFAWDDQFVYVAVQTPSRHLQPTNESNSENARDADLTHSDRVCLALDLDRDLLTSMNVTFTRDGQTHDALDGFDGWNPTWYVATQESADLVTTEIAIEQSSLAGPIGSGDSWFIEAKAIPAGQPQRFNMMPDAASRVRVDFQ